MRLGILLWEKERGKKYEAEDPVMEKRKNREKQRNRYPIKQYVIWFGLLVKRLCRQPVYLMLLALIPISGLALGAAGRGERAGALVAVCTGESGWRESIEDDLRRQDADSVVDFVFCADDSAVQKLVLSGDADCGFVIGDDIDQKVSAGEWDDCITAYETSSSSIAGIAQEYIAGAVFKLYSEQRYADRMAKISEEAAEYAMEAYEKRLTDGSTFAFRYIGNADEDRYSDSDSYSQKNSDTEEIYDTYYFPLKGVLAVIIFISGMCGMLDYDRDIREKRFVRLAPNGLTYIVDVWIPQIILSAAALLCMRAAGKAWNVSDWLAQTGRLIAYQAVVVVYCCMLRILLRRRETIAAAIPVLALGSLVCAPVFIRLGAYLPVFTVLEKMFPATYYLLM